MATWLPLILCPGTPYMAGSVITNLKSIELAIAIAINDYIHVHLLYHRKLKSMRVAMKVPTIRRRTFTFEIAFVSSQSKRPSAKMMLGGYATWANSASHHTCVSLFSGNPISLSL